MVSDRRALGDQAYCAVLWQLVTQCVAELADCRLRYTHLMWPDEALFCLLQGLVRLVQ